MVSPINWAITGFLETSTGLNKKIIVKTDVEVYLTCFVSLTDPEPHLVVRYQRGVRTWCTTKPAKVLWMQYPQTEYADTIYHTFMLPGPLLNLKHWVRFEGTFLGISTISNSPIFKRTKRTYWEPWEGSIGLYHPWQILWTTPGSFAALVNHHLLLSLPGSGAGDSAHIRTYLSNNPTAPEYMLLPRFMDTINTLPFTGHYFTSYINIIIRGPGYQMELMCCIAYPVGGVLPWNSPAGRYIFIGTGRTLTSLRMQLTIWLNYRGLPPNPELAHILAVEVYADNQPWPHPHPSALHQEYLDLIEELPE